MAVFIAASDETRGGNVASMYHYGGWIAPETDWSLFFTPAWQERVLDDAPQIPYVHMTDMRSRAWREKWLISQDEADRKLDEAARLIWQMGSLYPLAITIDGRVFEPLYKDFRVATKSGAKRKLEPDLIAFTSYAYSVLKYVKYKFPDAEKVDFLVENNSEITKHIAELYETLPDSVSRIGSTELIPLIGEFIPGGKDRVPLQAADYLCWHARRADEEMLDERDAMRWSAIATRKGFRYTLEPQTLSGIAKAFADREKENEKADGVRSLRQNNARPDKRSTQRNKSRSGRGKISKDKKKAEG